MEARTARLTLAQWFVLTTLALAGLVGVTSSVLLNASESEILARSIQQRDAAALRVGRKLSADLGVGAASLESVVRAARLGLVKMDDLDAVEARLFSELLEHPTLSDLTLTHATRLGYDDHGQARLAPEDRWQVTVYRQSPEEGSAFLTKRTLAEGGRFVDYWRDRPPGGALLSAPLLLRPGESADPTRHDTFEVPAERDEEGKSVWSDLSWSQVDARLPEGQRRAVLTVMRAVEDAPGHFAGVLRAGLLTRTLDDLPKLGKSSADDPATIFICDPGGRLITRLDPGDPLRVMGNDLRIAPANPGPVVSAALALPALREVSPQAEKQVRSDRVTVAGVPYLVTFRSLADSQDWVAGVVVPEEHYTRDLGRLRDRLQLALFATIALVLAGGGFAIALIRRALGRIEATTARMRRFDFAPSPTQTLFRDVAAVMDGLERAKTSVRALGKYVPVDLVRELFESNREPQLGGHLVDITLMFSDIEGFTTLSEKLTPDALAVALGRYLEAMTAGVRSTQGTVDKFIGDSVMAFWNAPSPLPDHARRAAHAVLACQRATRELYASPAWKGLPPLFTRFGLHTARVMVGHFGAPERLSYTALGDGVNLASRLEGLGKQYGVAVLASEALVAAAGDDFAFRLVDRVAVKGKEEAVRVYELLGLRAECADALAMVAPYETALEAYFARRFDRALEVLRAREDDPPSRVLAERCAAMLAHPPPADWNGVYVAVSK
jgi:adenylate cyclase